MNNSSETGKLKPMAENTEINGVSLQMCGICKEKLRENQIFSFTNCEHALVLCKSCKNQLSSCPYRCANSLKRQLILRELA